MYGILKLFKVVIVVTEEAQWNRVMTKNSCYAI